MSESERSDFGPPMSSDDAAELEELRREAAALREQLETTLSAQGGLRSARDIHQLEARIDSLAARNAKLMETLKEARQQLLGAARRGRSPRPAAQRVRRPALGSRGRHRRRLHIRTQDAADVLAQHRGAVAEEGPDGPAERGADSRRGGPFRGGRRDQHAAGDPFRRSPRAGGRPRRRGAHRLAGRAAAGDRGHGTRGGRRARAISTAPAGCGRATRCWSTPRPVTRSSASPRPRSKTSSSKRCPTSATTTSAG